MKTPIHLNIGLTTNDGQHVSANSALRYVTALGSILAARVVKGDAEDCLAVSVLLPDARPWGEQIHGIACILRQDCIAVLDGGQGLLIGPGAEKWGKFDPAAFIHPSTGLPLEVAPRVLPESECQARQREAREKLASVESDCQSYPIAPANSAFDKAAGIHVQRVRLIHWEKILKPEILAIVQREADERNEKLGIGANGYSVWRGTSIDEFIQNLALSLPVQ